MATSGSINFSQTRNEIINDSFQLLGILGVGRTISSEDLTFANNMLNKMVKAWQAQGIHLWAKEEGLLFIQDNTAEYVLSNASTSAQAADRNTAVITELNGAHSSGATSITVDSTTGMTVLDNIGVVQDDDVLTFTTIASIDSSTTLTLTVGLTADAADNSNVYTFTNRVNKPLRIHAMRRITGSPGTNTQSEIPMIQLSHSEYFDLPTKNTNGIASHFYYNPDIDDGRLYLWPRPDDPETFFGFTYTRMLEDFDSATDNADFPVEWLEVLTYQLAVRLAPGFGKDLKSMQLVTPMAAELLNNMLNWDTETSSLYLQPDRGYR